MSVVRSREVVRISEVRNTLDVCYRSIGDFQFACSTKVVHILKGPLREVPLYMTKSSARVLRRAYGGLG